MAELTIASFLAWWSFHPANAASVLSADRIWRIILLIPYFLPGLLLLAVLGNAAYNHYLHPLAGYPGPRFAGISRIWWLWHALTGDLHRQLVLLHRRYGQTVRIAPDEISYTHPQVWKEIYAPRPGRPVYERDPRDLINEIPDILSSDLAQHAPIRRQLAHGFSDKALREQEPLVIRYADELIAQLGKRCDESETGLSKPQNMSLWFNLYTFDTGGQLIFGEDFGSLRSAALDPHILTLFRGVKYISFARSLNRVPGFNIIWRTLLPLALFLRKLILPKQLRDAKEKQMNRTKEMVDRRVSRTLPYADLGCKLVENTALGTLTLTELYQNSDTLLVGGSETAATLLAAAVFYLANHPAAYRAVAKEIRTTFSDPSTITTRTINAQTCPYLLAVLDESLRLFSPTSILLARVVPEGGDVILGKHIPAGTAVGVNPYASGRDPLNFTRPDEFVPERWLESEWTKPDSEFANDRREVHQPFSEGPRNCIGRKLSYVEVRIALAKLVWGFELQLERESRNWVEVQDVFIGWQKPPLMVRLKRATH